MHGATSTQIVQAGRPTKQRPEADVRTCLSCGARLARDNDGPWCSPCERRSQRRTRELMRIYDVEALTAEASATDERR